MSDYEKMRLREMIRNSESIVNKLKFAITTSDSLIRVSEYNKQLIKARATMRAYIYVWNELVGEEI